MTFIAMIMNSAVCKEDHPKTVFRIETETINSSCLTLLDTDMLLLLINFNL